MPEIIKGAEAEISLEDDKVIKKRVRKKYRHPELDERIREERTRTEARIIREARKNGVKVPGVRKVSDDTLEIDRLEGDQLKDVIEEDPGLMEELGENTAKLHDADIIHGDLTTRNVIVSGKVYLIDFGLSFRSQRIEDRAIDLHLLKQVLDTSHPDTAGEAWQHFLEGYRRYSKSEAILERLEEVEERGRYK